MIRSLSASSGPMTASGQLRASYRDALVSREFRALLGSQLVVVGGMSVAAVAPTVLVFQRTGPPLLASLTFALNFLPYLLGGGLMSSVVDRVRPRRLVALCDATSAALVAVMALPGLDGRPPAVAAPIGQAWNALPIVAKLCGPWSSASRAPRSTSRVSA